MSSRELQSRRSTERLAVGGLVPCRCCCCRGCCSENSLKVLRIGLIVNEIFAAFAVDDKLCSSLVLVFMLVLRMLMLGFMPRDAFADMVWGLVDLCVALAVAASLEEVGDNAAATRRAKPSGLLAGCTFPTGDNDNACTLLPNPSGLLAPNDLCMPAGDRLLDTSEGDNTGDEAASDLCMPAGDRLLDTSDGDNTGDEAICNIAISLPARELLMLELMLLLRLLWACASNSNELSDIGENIGVSFLLSLLPPAPAPSCAANTSFTIDDDAIAGEGALSAAAAAVIAEIMSAGENAAPLLEIPA